ncbi:hypothetical protein QNI16_10460 [Cytophagaceae bacterium YF14B1]|uniref:DUF3997 domain-containing protein n=1 Tax=Xanthocytophaga flava TaxID=3048013 RepID=A0AAE3U8P5_9BACT|nr:hypothetical protein [Xanthocytophaga flavus]MDJ1480904.1 hypothetical protein [Xanthocytophaga flavus]
MKKKLKFGATSFVFVMVVLAIISSCTHREENWNGHAIKRPGEYFMKDKDLKIQVWDDEDGIINYCVTKSEADTLIRSPKEINISAYHEWILVWDEKDRLWVESSDVGGYFWLKDSLTSRYEQKDFITDSLLVKDIPKEIFELLPKSIQEKLSAE